MEFRAVCTKESNGGNQCSSDQLQVRGDAIPDVASSLFVNFGVHLVPRVRVGFRSAGPNDPDIVAASIHDPGDDRNNLLRERGATLAAAHSGADGDEGDLGPALEHIDMPNQVKVVVGESVVQGVEDRVRQVREQHKAKLADLGR